jgi:hypothetical protein
MKILLVEEGKFIFFLKVLLLDGVKESLTVFKGIPVVKKNNFDQGIVQIRGIDFLLGIEFLFLMDQCFFLSVGGNFAEPGRRLSQERGIHQINYTLFIRFNFIITFIFNF